MPDNHPTGIPTPPPTYSIVVAVYNRPKEMEELLQSLVAQEGAPFQHFQLIVVEDGSRISSAHLFKGRDYPFTVHYLQRENGGPGAARNTGAMSSACNTPYVLFFDSDCILPPHFFRQLLQWHAAHPNVELWGGPDASGRDFSSWQKAVSFAMTWRGSTGGIRGSSRDGQGFTPRTFNMGIARARFLEVGGFAPVRYGEDVDLSLRVQALGARSELAKELEVLHKRRENLGKFFQQVRHSGAARVWLSRRHNGSLKPLHALPLLGIIGMLTLLAMGGRYALTAIMLDAAYALLIIICCMKKERNLGVALRAVVAVHTMILGYGVGFLCGIFQQQGE